VETLQPSHSYHPVLVPGDAAFRRLLALPDSGYSTIAWKPRWKEKLNTKRAACLNHNVFRSQETTLPAVLIATGETVEAGMQEDSTNQEFALCAA
jgi:hypothetical protein